MTTLDSGLASSAYAVIDVETTGFCPGQDRIVEICILRMDPGQAPAIVLDTLVDPGRPVAGSKIHGISQSDLIGAPTLAEIAGEILRALSGRVVVGHNVSFDLRFLGRDLPPCAGLPFVDTSFLRPLLGDGERMTLTDTCAAYGIGRSGAHVASADVIDTGRVLEVLLQRAQVLGLRTFRDLARRGEYGFLRSFVLPTLSGSDATRLPPSTVRRSRVRRATENPLQIYSDALLLVLFDGQVSPEEVRALADLQGRLDLAPEDVFALHAQAFTGALLGGMVDSRIDRNERMYLANLANCLRTLGWCPGDALAA